MVLLAVFAAAVQAGDSEFVFYARPSGHEAVIDNAAINGNPRAILIVTPHWNPGGTQAGVYNNHNIGVYYIAGSGRWSIFNQDFAAMPAKSSFNVMVRPASQTAFFHRAAGANISGNYTLIDSPATNGNPGALLFITPNWNAGGANGVYNDHPTGVFYLASAGKWAIYNEDMAAMPENAAFNVVVMRAQVAADYGNSTFLHNATSRNILLNYTTIDHAGSNNKGNAMVFVTHNWGESGIYNSHPTGVFYISDRQGGGKWAIFNQDKVALPTGVNFNVFVRWPGPE